MNNEKIIEKIETHLQSIDSIVYNYVKSNNYILAGGSLLDILDDRAINDYDFWAITGITSIHYNLGYVRDLINHLKDLGCYRVSYGTSNAVTVNSKYQFIRHQYSSIDDIFDSFDFDICKIAYDVANKKLFYSKEWLDAYKSKRISPNFDKCKKENIFKYSGLFRIIKYLKKGYDIDNKEIIDLFMLISKNNFNDRNDLLFAFHNFSSEGYVINKYGNIYEDTINKETSRLELKNRLSKLVDKSKNKDEKFDPYNPDPLDYL